MKRCIIIVAAMVLFPMQAFALPKVTVQLPWYLSVEWAGIVMAIEDGIDRKHGVDIDVLNYEPGVDPVESVAKGRADIGLIDAVSLIQKRAEGADVVGIWAQMQVSPVSVCTLTDNGIRTLDDLKGKRFGIQKEYEYLLDMFLSRGNVAKADLNVIYIEGDPVIPLETGEVDAVCCFDTYQPPIMRIRGSDPYVLRASDLGLSFYEQVMFVDKDELEHNDGVIQRAVDAIAEGWVYALNHVDRTVDVVVNNYRPFDPSEWLLETNEQYVAQQSASLKLIYAYMTKGVGMRLGFMRDYRWQQTIDMLLELGMIDEPMKPGELYTRQFLVEKR